MYNRHQLASIGNGSLTVKRPEIAAVPKVPHTAIKVRRHAQFCHRIHDLLQHLQPEFPFQLTAVLRFASTWHILSCEKIKDLKKHGKAKLSKVDCWSVDVSWSCLVDLVPVVQSVDLACLTLRNSAVYGELPANVTIQLFDLMHAAMGDAREA